eukprot:s1274_g17.t1
MGLHSVSDEARRQIYNATCRALNQEDKQVVPWKWKEISEAVLPDIFYPVELPAVEDGKKVVFYMCSVRKCLETVMQRCKNYAKLVQQKLNETPDLVFDLLCYNDEAAGGNILAPNSAKKVSLWYFCLQQVGYLWSDCVWHPLCVLQHSLFEKIKGGFSCFTCKVVQELQNQNLREGFPVSFPDRLGLLRLQLTHMLSDLDSIRYALDAKGSAGIRCCIFCKNCIKKDTQLSEYNEYFKDISNTDFSVFDEQTDGEIFEVIDQLLLMAPGLSKSTLRCKETACGFNANPDGLLSHRLAREALPPSAFLLDTMHLYFSNGILSWEMNSMYTAWTKTEVGDLPRFLALDWQTQLLQNCPPSFRKQLAQEYLFSGNSYKGSASNLLAFFPLFEYFLSRVLTSRSLLEKELASFQALRKITMELRRVQHCRGPLTVDKLQELQSIHQDLMIKAWRGCGGVIATGLICMVFGYQIHAAVSHSCVRERGVLPAGLRGCRVSGDVARRGRGRGPWPAGVCSMAEQLGGAGALAAQRLDMHGQLEAPRGKGRWWYWPSKRQAAAAAYSAMAAHDGLQLQQVVLRPVSITYVGLKVLVEGGQLACCDEGQWRLHAALQIPGPRDESGALLYQIHDAFVFDN